MTCTCGTSGWVVTATVVPCAAQVARPTMAGSGTESRGRRKRPHSALLRATGPLAPGTAGPGSSPVPRGMRLPSPRPARTSGYPGQRGGRRSRQPHCPGPRPAMPSRGLPGPHPRCSAGGPGSGAGDGRGFGSPRPTARCTRTCLGCRGSGLGCCRAPQVGGRARGIWGRQRRRRLCRVWARSGLGRWQTRPCWAWRCLGGTTTGAAMTTTRTGDARRRGMQ